MNNPFWLSQVGPQGLCAWDARKTIVNAEDPFANSEGPVWCFFRLGVTRTELSDGRIICIGGEHKDRYDPDFCIYNGKFFYKSVSATEQEGSAKLQFLYSR